MVASEGGFGVDEGLEVTVLPPAGATERGAAELLEAMGEVGAGVGAGAGVGVFVKFRGVEAVWRAGPGGLGRVVLRCEAEQTEALLAGLAEFAYYEGELRRMEGEIAAGWVELEEDKGLAFEVTAADLRRNAVVGGRMGRVLARRIRLARMEPLLYAPGVGLAAAGQKLGEELRERARVEARVETLDGQLEVFESVYEMSGQRMGEFRAAHQEQILEWVIVGLLALEVAVMLLRGSKW